MVMPCPMQAHATLSVQLDHKCLWEQRAYDGGPYKHSFRTCSYCGGMNPEDLIALLDDEGSEVDVEGTTKGYKFYVRGVPNPIAGQRCRSGSHSGPVFRRRDLTLLQRLRARHDMPEGLSPTIAERIAGHYERTIYRPAPRHCFAKFYTYHIESEEQQARLNYSLQRRRLVRAGEMSERRD